MSNVRNILRKNKTLIDLMQIVSSAGPFLLPASTPYRDILAEGFYSLSNLLAICNHPIFVKSDVNATLSLLHISDFIAAFICHVEVFLEGIANVLGYTSYKNMLIIILEATKAICRLIKISINPDCSVVEQLIGCSNSTTTSPIMLLNWGKNENTNSRINSNTINLDHYASYYRKTYSKIMMLATTTPIILHGNRTRGGERRINDLQIKSEQHLQQEGSNFNIYKGRRSGLILKIPDRYSNKNNNSVISSDISVCMTQETTMNVSSCNERICDSMEVTSNPTLNESCVEGGYRSMHSNVEAVVSNKTLCKSNKTDVCHLNDNSSNDIIKRIAVATNDNNTTLISSSSDCKSNSFVDEINSSECVGCDPISNNNKNYINTTPARIRSNSCCCKDRSYNGYCYCCNGGGSFHHSATAAATVVEEQDNSGINSLLAVYDIYGGNIYDTSGKTKPVAPQSSPPPLLASPMSTTATTTTLDVSINAKQVLPPTTTVTISSQYSSPPLLYNNNNNSIDTSPYGSGSSSNKTYADPSIIGGNSSTEYMCYHLTNGHIKYNNISYSAEVIHDSEDDEDDDDDGRFAECKSFDNLDCNDNTIEYDDDRSNPIAITNSDNTVVVPIISSRMMMRGGDIEYHHRGERSKQQQHSEGTHGDSNSSSNNNSSSQCSSTSNKDNMVYSEEGDCDVNIISTSNSSSDSWPNKTLEHTFSNTLVEDNNCITAVATTNTTAPCASLSAMPLPPPAAAAAATTEKYCSDGMQGSNYTCSAAPTSSESTSKNHSSSSGSNSNICISSLLSAADALRVGEVLYILRPVVYAIMIHYQTSSISCDQKNSNETGSSSSSEHPTKNNLSWLKSYYGSNNNNNNNSTAPLTSSVSSTNYSLLSNSATASIEKALMATLALIVSFALELLSIQLTNYALQSTRHQQAKLLIRNMSQQNNNDNENRKQNEDSINGYNSKRYRHCNTTKASDSTNNNQISCNNSSGSRIGIDYNQLICHRNIRYNHAWDAELNRRRFALFLYLIRSPIFDRATYPLLRTISTTLKHTPLIGSLPEYILSVFEYLNKMHFYNSNS